MGHLHSVSDTWARADGFVAVNASRAPRRRRSALPTFPTDQAMSRGVHEEHDQVEGEQAESNPTERLNVNEDGALAPEAAEAFRRNVVLRDKRKCISQ